MAHIQFVDSIVREYMLFRGFSSSLKTFDADLKTDKDKGFRVDKVIDQIIHLINSHDLQALRDIWNHLDAHLFSKLEQNFASAVRKLESSLLKLYLVTAYTSGKQDKITEFFNKLATELHSYSEWKEWFFFPFCKNPEEHPLFSVCFSKQWQDTLLVSLHNFLATIFQCMPQPTLTRLDVEATQMKKLQDENQLLRNRLQIINQSQQGTSSSSSPKTSSSTHQSRQASFQDQRRSVDGRQRQSSASNTQTLNDVIPFNIPPPAHIIDDFYIIAQETLNVSNAADSQGRSLRSIIRNIGSGGSPVMGRKESLDRGKKRSGSVGSRSWNLH